MVVSSRPQVEGRGPGHVKNLLSGSGGRSSVALNKEASCQKGHGVVLSVGGKARKFSPLVEDINVELHKSVSAVGSSGDVDSPLTLEEPLLAGVVLPTVVGVG